MKGFFSLFILALFIGCNGVSKVKIDGDGGSIVPTTPAPPPPPPPPVVPLSNFNYPYNELVLGNGEAMADYTPTISGDNPVFTIDPALPVGLSIDSATGVISGTPSAVLTDTTYTVTATNDENSKSFSIKLNIADSFIVDTLNDGADDDTFDGGICFSTAAAGCSLRAAIESTNVSSARMRIKLGTGTYFISTGLPALTQSAIIIGDGNDKTIIDTPGGGSAYRLFIFNTGGRVYKLSHVKIKNFGTAASPDSNGAAVLLSAGTLEESFNVYENNKSANGGVFLVSGTAILNSKYSTFQSNEGTTWGGVLHIENTAQATFEGVYATQNKSAWGGFSHASAGSVVNILNSTLYANVSTSNGVTATPGGDYVIKNSTITGNTNTGTGAAGIYFFSDSSHYDIGNSIIAHNRDSLFNSSDCHRNTGNSTLTSLGGNIISDGGGNCAGLFVGPGDQLSTDPLFSGFPADNGGYTFSMLLDSLSPAIDGGVNAECTSIDQIGTTRPLPYIGATALCDSGAIEMVQ